MSKSELIAAVEQVCDEKNIPFDSVIESIEAALAVAYRKEAGDKMLNVRAEFNVEDGSADFFDVKTVTEDPTEEDLAAFEQQEKERELAREQRRDNRERREEAETLEEEEWRFNPKTDIGISEAAKMKKDAELGDEIVTELPLPDDFGRVAAQTAKQVIIQKLREAERETLFNQYKDKVGSVINATVHRVEGPLVYMDLGQATALMPPAEQIRGERYTVAARYKVYLKSVEQGKRGPEIIASRGAAEMVADLFTVEVPEIANGLIEIKAVAREGGSRSKIAVWTDQENIDPIGSCVGQRGARVQTVMNELGGEKIDIIEWSDDVKQNIMNALSPAKVDSVELDEEAGVATVQVPADQLSLAIGRGGQNVRLAAKLCGWKIDVVKDASTETVVESTEEVSDEEVADVATPEQEMEKLEEQIEEVAVAEDNATDEVAE